jgi:hypothetical protein
LILLAVDWLSITVLKKYPYLPIHPTPSALATILRELNLTASKARRFNIKNIPVVQSPSQAGGSTTTRLHMGVSQIGVINAKRQQKQSFASFPQDAHWLSLSNRLYQYNPSSTNLKACGVDTTTDNFIFLKYQDTQLIAPASNGIVKILHQ